MSKFGAIENQASYRADAARFFEWCRFNLNHHAEKLDTADKKRFESGKIPKSLLDVVRAAWSTNLKSHLPWDEHFAAIRRALTNPSDYDRWMNTSMHLLQSLPKRIRVALSGEEKRRGKEIHDAFFSNGGETRLVVYLRVWQSQRRALNKLIIKAWGYRCKAAGGASVGATEIDVERMILSEAEATGSALKATGLPLFLRSLWETDKTLIVKTAAGFERRVIPNPDRSEARLNRFLIKLGRALARTEKRRALPDWLHGVDQTERFIVHGWCESITVDNEHWPPLCFLTTPALTRFLRMCKVTHSKLGGKDSRTIERAIQRLGLVRIPQGRIKHVERRGGSFHFS